MVNYNDLNNLFLLKFPELKAEYEKANFNGMEQMGPHVICGDVLLPYLYEALRTRKDQEVTRAAEFIEVLAQNGDKETKNLVEATICESMVDTDDIRDAIEPHLGDATLEIFQKIRREWSV